MVFKGQDAWRKHPLLVNCSKVPFPAFGMAVKIFAVYMVVDCYISYITAPPPSPYKPVQYRWNADGMPVLKKSSLSHGHH